MKGHAASSNPGYVDPLSNEGFMQVFGDEDHKEFIINFLNALLEGAEIIRDLQFVPFLSPSLKGEILFDLLCTDDRGKHFLVHLQRSEEVTPDGSLMFHGTRLTLRQPKVTGEEYLTRIYCVGLMNSHFKLNREFECIKDTRICFKVGNKTNDCVHNVNVLVRLVELPLFTTPENKLKTDLDQWLFLLKNMGGMTEIPEAIKGSVFEQLFQAGAAKASA